MNIHLISIGGAVMHNLALALQQNGHQVSGSDDEIYEPAKSRLYSAGLLPEEKGWNAQRIHGNLDLIILGMHARKDNPELLRAQELGLKIQSFPEYFASCAENKKRVVVAGSHGKTSTTAMIMHVLKQMNVAFDYLVGAQLEGFDTMVRLSDAPIAVIEGDEYLSSAIDLKSKFLWYKPHLSVITGIAWDHINVFPTFDSYLNTFKEFVQDLPENGKVFMFEQDPYLEDLKRVSAAPVQAYGSIPSKLDDGKLWLKTSQIPYPIQVFGEHNLQNMQAARLICLELGISDEDFAQHISGFKGAAKRLECLQDDEDLIIYRDFAHAPSKVKATVEAVRSRYPDRKILAVYELHTYSSLRPEFLPGYSGSMNAANRSWVYYDPHVFEMKKMPVIQAEVIQKAFGSEVRLTQDSVQLKNEIDKELSSGAVLLLMSSGNFGGMSLTFHATK